MHLGGRRLLCRLCAQRALRGADGLVSDAASWVSAPEGITGVTVTAPLCARSSPWSSPVPGRSLVEVAGLRAGSLLSALSEHVGCGAWPPRGLRGSSYGTLREWYHAPRHPRRCSREGSRSAVAPAQRPVEQVCEELALLDGVVEGVMRVLRIW